MKRELETLNVTHARVPGWMTLVVCALWACTLGGCSTYDASYSFTPGLTEHIIMLEDAQPVQTVRTLVSITGVRRANAKAQEPASVEVRFRIENASDVEAAIDRASLRLVPADLGRLDRPIIAEGGTVAPPRSDVMFVAWFPFPAGSSAWDFDLNGLSVSWSILVDGVPRPQSATYTRRRVLYRPYPAYGFHVGYGRYYCR